MSNHPNRSKRYTYSARTANQDGEWRAHKGGISGAIRKAKAYAADVFPAWQYSGHGPTITVRDESGGVVHEERL